MKIISGINQNYTSKNKQAFGMQVRLMNEDAWKLSGRWFYGQGLEKMMPRIDEMKTKNGNEILVEVYGNLKTSVLNFVGKAENEQVDGIVLSHNHSTYNGNDPMEILIDTLDSTLTGIQKSLDKKIKSNNGFNIDLKEIAKVKDYNSYMAKFY